LVLKCFAPDAARELAAYALFAECGVPTLPVHGRGIRALLLEDLSTSAAWRAAAPTDMESAAVGVALADWYRRLHAVGRALCAQADPHLSPFLPWIDTLTARTLQQAAQRLDLCAAPVWPRVLAAHEALKARYRRCPQTLIYEDFAAENLALSTGDPIAAVVFDYDEMTIGVAASDCRNVLFSLGPAAAAAFQAAYGPISEVEQRLDAVLSVLYGLVVAAGRAQLPGWAAPLVRQWWSGELAQALELACESL
jgi:Ser/Thr protein kinase RdoA (MazF antagonist)